jgi:riboflavin kinase/FMN adenylyltransferase
MRWLKEAGADEVVALKPTREFLAQVPQAFMAAVCKEFSPSHIVEGGDFRFGSKRTGSVETIVELERTFGYRTTIVESVKAALSDQSVVRVSSTMIRWLLARGRVRDAAMLLGRPYELRSEVIMGDQRGRTIGLPTVNLAHSEQILPADGIYRGAATLPDGKQFVAAISVGTKPTFGEHPRICEAHLIGYDGPLDNYGWMVQVRFHDWLRDQLTFASVEQLVAQLRRDIRKTAEHFPEQAGSAAMKTSARASLTTQHSS